MAKRCGCASEFCACVIKAGDGVTVEGQGTKTFPYEISAIPGTVDLAVQDENGVVVSSATIFDFQGAGVTATQGATGEAIITIPGASMPDSPWTAYTPTITGITGATSAGRWTTIGKTTHVHATIFFGAGSTFTGAPGVSLPFGIQTAGPHNLTLTDVGSNSFVGLVAVGATALAGYALGPNGAAAAISATNPFPWAAGDIIDYHITYERI